MSVREVIKKYHDKLEADHSINPIPTRVLDEVVIEVLEQLKLEASTHSDDYGDYFEAVSVSCIDEALKELRR